MVHLLVPLNDQFDSSDTQLLIEMHDFLTEFIPKTQIGLINSFNFIDAAKPTTSNNHALRT